MSSFAPMAGTSKTWRPPIINVVPLNHTASWALLRPPLAGAGSTLAPAFFPFLRSVASLVRFCGADAPGRVSVLLVARRSGKAARILAMSGSACWRCAARACSYALPLGKEKSSSESTGLGEKTCERKSSPAYASALRNSLFASVMHV
eukprot:1225240-Pleurochrysis_carterae.AAC.1